MLAAIQERYGAPSDHLKLQEAELPEVGPDDVLVRVRASSVNPADWHLLRGEPYIARLQIGMRAPKHPVLGCDVAGEVEAAGATFERGDEVFGSPYMRGFGGFAEYVRVPADRLARKPAGLSFEQAAAVPLAGCTALQGLRDHGQIEPGQRVLVVGASGGVGTFAVQIAKALGAHVTGVCSTGAIDLVRSLGADAVLDYTREEVSERYDLVLQVAGTRSPQEWRRALTPKGTLVIISGDSPGRVLGAVGRVVKALVLTRFVSQRIANCAVKPNAQDLAFLGGLLEAGRLRPVIDRTYALADLPQALGYLEEGHARGKVVVTV